MNSGVWRWGCGPSKGLTEAGCISSQTKDMTEQSVSGYQHVLTQIKESVGSKKFLYTGFCPKFSNTQFLTIERMLGF